ncbi:MAG: hypothetical protein AAGC95_00435 [Pseudomonadota bacterium]
MADIRPRLYLFYAASLLGFAIESVVLAIGLTVILTAILTGLHPTAFANFVNLLVDHYLSAPRPAKIEFMIGVLFAGVLTSIFVAAVRAPAHMRRIRQDARQRFVAKRHRPMPRIEAQADDDKTEAAE